jgi:hypothetical protein
MIDQCSDSTPAAKSTDGADPGASQPGPPPRTGRGWIVTVFGDITRAGSWPHRRTTSPVALFGDIDLDLRQATVPAGGVVISAIAPFGNIDVVVPVGSQVDVGGFTLFGSKKISVTRGESDGTAPLIRVRGFSLFGSLKVWSP